MDPRRRRSVGRDLDVEVVEEGVEDEPPLGLVIRVTTQLNDPARPFGRRRVAVLFFMVWTSPPDCTHALHELPGVRGKAAVHGLDVHMDQGVEPFLLSSGFPSPVLILPPVCTRNARHAAWAFSLLV